MYYKGLVTLWVAVCVFGVCLSQTPMGPKPGQPQGNPNPNNQPPPPDQKPPVWLQCMADSTGQDVSDSGIKDIFETWCSNYEQIVECLTTNLPPSAETNPFDFFISVDFDADRLKEASKEFCGLLKGASGQLSCSAQQNKTLATVCGHGFTRGLFHIYDLFKRDNPAPQEVLSQIACDVTTQTTFCLRQTLPDCSPQLQTILINYYALFTNGSCVAGADYQPPSPQPRRPDTIVVKCAAEASDTLDKDPVEPSSVVDFVVLGLQTDCKTFPARFSCYDRELRNITNFLDFWLSLTFDFDNAMASQKSYCDKIESLIIPNLTSECFNKSQPALSACEEGFGREVETIRKEWVQNPDFDGVQLQTLACRTSVTRAVCLGNSMAHCGEQVAVEMRKSEMGILPDVCQRLLTSPRPDTTSRNDDMANNRNPDYGTRDSSSERMNERPANGMDYTKEHRKPVGQQSGNNMADGNHMKDENNNNNDDDGGVGVVNANYHLICMLFLSSFLAYKHL